MTRRCHSLQSSRPNNPHLMKALRSIFIVASLLLGLNASAQSPDIDKALSDLATKLATLTQENAKKKVTVLDFTDLQGGASELGKYIAEELTVNLVIVKSNFSVLDRANLRRILAEHKLTATGLVDPENAKKLGQFAGVDALILGTIVPKNQNVQLTTKIITTDTAEIVGAAKAEFKSDETVQKLSSQAALSEDTATAVGAPAARSIASQDFSNLRVNVDKLRILDDGTVMVHLSFQNKSAKNSIAVALYHDVCFMQPCMMRTTLVAANGKQFTCSDAQLKGIGSMRFGPDTLTEIEPGATIKASIHFADGRLSARTTSFTLQSEIVVNQNYRAGAYANYQLNENSLPPGCKIHNLVLEIPSP